MIKYFNSGNLIIIIGLSVLFFNSIYAQKPNIVVNHLTVESDVDAMVIKKDYRIIEAYRNSKEGNVEYGGSSEDVIIQKWIDLIWSEGWVRKAGFDINISQIKKSFSGDNEEKKAIALRQLNEYTELIYADGSVGNVRNKNWKLPNAVSQISSSDNIITLQFRNLNQKSYLLDISFFEDGLIHVKGSEAGYFNDEALVPAKIYVKETGDRIEVEYQNQPISVTIKKAPFAIKVYKRGVLKLNQTEFNVSESLSAPRGVRVRFKTAEDDKYIGFGERFDRFQHKHTIFAQWSMGMAEALKNGSPETYKPIPFYLNPVNSTGMFYNHGGIVRWDIEGSELGVMDITSVGGICDYFLFVGDNPYDIYRAYTKVTGRIFNVPEWVHMPWMGHHFGKADAWGGRHERLIDELVGYNKYGFTYGAMYAAGIGSSGKEIESIYEKYMAPLGVNLGVHLDPLVKLNKGELATASEEEIRENVIMRENGEPFVSDHAFQAGKAYYDYSSPIVIEKEFNGGIHKIFMLDFGEQAGWDAQLSAYPNYSGRESHNLYQYLYHRAAYLAHMKKYPDGDWMSFARSGWAGDHAIGGFFAGDTNSSLDDLKRTIRAGINMCASAGVYWGADIGAYKRKPTLTKETYLRWGQFGLFSPLMRTHAHEEKEMRPWKYDNEMMESYKYYCWLRASLVPYIQESGFLATSDGIPIMRALPIEFPKDVNAYLDDEYMFGPSLLVAPYLTEKFESRKVYLPEGTWFNFFTREKYSGKKEIEQSSENWKEMPVYVRAPAILPIKIGNNSSVPGDSYFKSTGTDLYTNPAIDAFRIYPEGGVAQAVFSHASVSYEGSNGAIVLKINADAMINQQLHFEIVDVSQVMSVLVGNVTLTESSSWREMMDKSNHYYYDGKTHVLFVNYNHR